MQVRLILEALEVVL